MQVYVFGGFNGEDILKSARCYTPPDAAVLSDAEDYGSWQKLPGSVSYWARRSMERKVDSRLPGNYGARPVYYNHLDD